MFDCDISQSRQNSPLSIKRFLLDLLDSYVRQARVSVRSMAEGAVRELGLPQMADLLHEQLQLKGGSKDAPDIVRASLLLTSRISKELRSLFLIVLTAITSPHFSTSPPPHMMR
jgi:hypothetical protein